MGAALLGYDYAARRAVLEDPPEVGEVSPHVYVLCATCAERLRPPQGWLLDDVRSEPPLFLATEPVPETHVAPETEELEVTARRQLFFGYSA